MPSAGNPLSPAKYFTQVGSKPDFSRRELMRTIFLAITAAFTVGITASASAPPAPTYARCQALSEQRGAGIAAGGGNHRRFMSDCLAGKVPGLAIAKPT